MNWPSRDADSAARWKRGLLDREGNAWNCLVWRRGTGLTRRIATGFLTAMVAQDGPFGLGIVTCKCEWITVCRSE